MRAGAQVIPLRPRPPRRPFGLGALADAVATIGPTAEQVAEITRRQKQLVGAFNGIANMFPGATSYSTFMPYGPKQVAASGGAILYSTWDGRALAQGGPIGGATPVGAFKEPEDYVYLHTNGGADAYTFNNSAHNGVSGALAQAFPGGYTLPAGTNLWTDFRAVPPPWVNTRLYPLPYQQKAQRLAQWIAEQAAAAKLPLPWDGAREPTLDMAVKGPPPFVFADGTFGDARDWLWFWPKADVYAEAVLAASDARSAAFAAKDAALVLNMNKAISDALVSWKAARQVQNDYNARVASATATGLLGDPMAWAQITATQLASQRQSLVTSEQMKAAAQALAAMQANLRRAQQAGDDATALKVQAEIDALQKTVAQQSGQMQDVFRASLEAAQVQAAQAIIESQKLQANLQQQIAAAQAERDKAQTAAAQAQATTTAQDPAKANAVVAAASQQQIAYDAQVAALKATLAEVQKTAAESKALMEQKMAQAAEQAQASAAQGGDMQALKAAIDAVSAVTAAAQAQMAQQQQAMKSAPGALTAGMFDASGILAFVKAHPLLVGAGVVGSLLLLRRSPAVMLAR